LEKSVKVKIGDGRILEATKVGNIKTYFLIYGQNSEVSIHIDKYFLCKRNEGKPVKLFKNHRQTFNCFKRKIVKNIQPMEDL